MKSQFALKATFNEVFLAIFSNRVAIRKQIRNEEKIQIMLNLAFEVVMQPPLVHTLFIISIIYYIA